MLRVNQSLAKTAASVNYPSARPPRLIQIVAPFSSRLSRDIEPLHHCREERTKAVSSRDQCERDVQPTPSFPRKLLGGDSSVPVHRDALG
jgi:hypothetical protein